MTVPIQVIGKQAELGPKLHSDVVVSFNHILPKSLSGTELYTHAQCWYLQIAWA